MQRTVFTFITRYEDDTVEIYKEGTEIQSLYFWRTTDELNVSRLVFQNISRPVKIAFPDCGQRTPHYGIQTWNMGLSVQWTSVNITLLQSISLNVFTVNLATSFRQFGIDMRMEKSSGLQNFSEKWNDFADQWSQAV